MRDWEKWVLESLNLPEMAGHQRKIVTELASYLESIWREARARGANEKEADALVCAAWADRRKAVTEFGSGRSGRKGRRSPLLADLPRDLRLAVRTLVRRPLFTAVVVLVLALGIGATTAIFTLLHDVILSPLPFPDADQLVALGHSAPNVGRGNVGQCAAWHFTYEDENRVFEELGMYSPGGSATITGSGEPEAVPILSATSGVFRALGIKPVLGRIFTRKDEDPDAPAIVLLSHGFWRTRFGADQGIIGKMLQVDGGTREIVGVLPASLSTLGQEPAIIVPLRFRRANLFVGNVGFNGIARLKAGVAPEQARADMARMLPLALEKFPGGPVIEAVRQANYVPEVQLLKVALVGSVADILWILMAGVAVVLLIACANVANLFLVRAEGRDNEMAIRAALGAGRGRMCWEYLKESLLLGILGGMGGIGLAYAGLRGLVAIAPTQLPRMNEVSLNPRVLILTLGVSLAAGAVFGAFPVLRRRRWNLVGSLKQGGRAGASGYRRNWTQTLLAVSQVALALVLLIASGLVLRTAQVLHNVDPGFSHAEDVLALRLSIPSRMTPKAEEAALLQEAIARRLGEMPGVTSVGMATSLPMHAGNNINPLFVEGITIPGKTPPITRRHKWIGERYFETLGIPLRAGRAFTWQDVHNRAPAVVVSESLARAYWGSVEAAIGKRVSVRPDPIRWHEVVGVAADVREDGVSLEPVPMVYWPQVTLAFWQGSAVDQVLLWRSASYAIRSDRVGTPDFLREVRNAIWSVNPNLPLLNVGPLSSFVAQSTARTSFTLILLGIAAGVALVLAMVGVYGVISCAMSHRTLELGMRMALGAQAGQVRRMVLRQGFLLTGTGILIGTGLALLLTDAMSSVLFGVSATDPLTFVTVAAGLTAVALAASYIPAYRASRINPIVVLKAE